ncbi:hypothetical protein L1987_34070 [Smallanthus sonchifolius]|uniref:Uncharacterized protein n=1 Tax=Smallanthus sonchifolius TaxID=185202 RepID=A0ACB9HUA9_9ASTR|nr:hypothetical protein L1987_34070 [Smallanthus sonchifolius]
MNTMGCRVNQDNNNHLEPPENAHFTPSDSWLQKPNAKSNTSQKQNANTEEKIADIIVLGPSSCPKIEGPKTEKPEEMSASQSPTHKSSNKKQIEDIAATDQTIEKPDQTHVSNSPIQELLATPEPCSHNGSHNINEKLPSQLEAQNPKEKVNVVAEVQADESTNKEQSVKREHKRKQVLPLSSLFK